MRIFFFGYPVIITGLGQSRERSVRIYQAILISGSCPDYHGRSHVRITDVMT